MSYTTLENLHGEAIVERQLDSQRMGNALAPKTDSRVRAVALFALGLLASVVCLYSQPEPQDTYPSLQSSLTVQSGKPSGNYGVGTQVIVIADEPPPGAHFTGWTGDTAILSNPFLSTTTATVPFMATTIVASYSAAETDDGTIIDLWRSFPDNQGDNGFFAYGYSAAMNTYRLLSDAGSYHFLRPEETRWNNPHVFRSDTVNGWFGQPWVGLHPSGTASNVGSPEDAVLAWVVPKTGYYQLTGGFLLAGSDNGADVYIKQNTKTLFSYHLAPGATRDFDVATSLFNAGDTICFGAGAHNNVGFSELNDWPFVKGQIQMVSAPDILDPALNLLPSYEFTLEQGAQKTESIQLFNSGTESRSANLEVINPHSGLTVSLAQPSITIAPGETLTLPIDLDAGSLPVGVYDGILLKVAIEGGSTLYSNINVYIVPPGTPELPDLAVSSRDIRAVTNADGTVTLTANIHNRGTLSAANVGVWFYEFDDPLSEEPVLITQISPNGIGIASLTVPAMTAGDHLIRVVVDPVGAIQELDEANNEASQIVRPGGPPPGPTEGNILVTGSLPSTVYAGSLFSITGRAVYALLVDGVTNTSYVVKGGAVQIAVSAEGGAKWVYGDVHTDTNGNFSRFLQAPTSPGTYRISMTVTDQTFRGTRELVFNVKEPPASPEPPPPPPMSSGAGNWTFDPPSSTWTWVWTTLPQEPIRESDLRIFSEDIRFSNDHPAANEEITVFAEIRYWASSTGLVAKDVPVNLYVTYPGSPRVKIGQAFINSLSVGTPDFGSRYVYATWKNQEEGIYITEVEIDPSYEEAYTLNNAATRAIIVGQAQGGLGGISGKVTDASKGIGNVIIRVFDSSGAIIASTVTDSFGSYSAESIPAGTAQVQIVMPGGYVTDEETKTVTVSAHSVSTVDFLLKSSTPPANTPPVVMLKGPSELTIEVAASYTDPGATATDAEDGAIEPVMNSNVVPNVPGSYSVTWRAIDSRGATGSARRKVSVVADATPPSFTSVPSGGDVPYGATIPDLASQATANDNTGGPVVITQSPPAGELFDRVGQFVVTLTATDPSGNAAMEPVFFNVKSTAGYKKPLSQGFWKNHPAAWPVTFLTLGNQTYTREELLAILRTPTRGDASLILASQLIAAKLNVANGSDPMPVNASIGEADRLLSGFPGKLPYNVKPSSPNGKAMVNEASTLESYNNSSQEQCQSETAGFPGYFKKRASRPSSQFWHPARFGFSRTSERRTERGGH